MGGRTHGGAGGGGCRGREGGRGAAHGVEECLTDKLLQFPSLFGFNIVSTMMCSKNAVLGGRLCSDEFCSNSGS